MPHIKPGKKGIFFINEHTYELKQDLKMPTKAERISEFKKLINDKRFKKDAIKTMSNTQKTLVQYNIGSKDSQNVNLKDLKSDNDYKAAYEVFNHSMEQAHQHKSTKEYINRMSSKYDAMVDDNNQGIYNDVHDPVIIFRTNQILKSIGTQVIKPEEINNNIEKVRSKTGKVMF